eukprot:scaffold67116_cov54-Attheya_sp.AAC.3
MLDLDLESLVVLAECDLVHLHVSSKFPTGGGADKKWPKIGLGIYPFHISEDKKHNIVNLTYH